MMIQISLPPDHHAAWTTQAESEELILSDWIRQCCTANLPESAVAGLSEIHRGKFTPQPVKANRSDANKTFRIPLRLADDHAAAWDAAAAKMQLSRSAWIRWCCTANLPAAVRKALSDPRGKGRPKTTGE